jgi:glycosyltransferase involved in cell wall biosynthesis
MPALVDRTVVASEGLAGPIGADPARSSVIEAMIEVPAGLCKDYSASADAAGIRVVWIGYPENLHLLAPVREALSDHRLSDFELVTISRGPQANIQWDRRCVWRQLLDCDIAVLPADETDWYRAKPNTRMTMLKALGLPIVASPIPSYEATLTHGRGCYFAREPHDWVKYLLALSELDRRRLMGLAERDAILASYGPDAIGGKWLELFEALAGRDDAWPAAAPVPLGGA